LIHFISKRGKPEEVRMRKGKPHPDVDVAAQKGIDPESPSKRCLLPIGIRRKFALKGGPVVFMAADRALRMIPSALNPIDDRRLEWLIIFNQFFYALVSSLSIWRQRLCIS
jgi:hypothetical protein